MMLSRSDDNYPTLKQVQDLAAKCNALRAAAKEKQMTIPTIKPLRHVETLSEFAQRKSREAKQEAARLYEEADKSDGSNVHEYLQKIVEKETEAQRWVEVA